VPEQSAAQDPGWGLDFDGGLAVFCDDPEWVPPEAPTEAELAGLCPDPDADPPDGENGWLADLCAPQLGALAREFAAARRPAAEAIAAGFTHRRAAADGAGTDWLDGVRRSSAPRPAGPARGFAASGPLDAAIPGPVLASLAQEVLDGGLAGVSDDELVGLLCAARRMTSWQAATELAVAAELDARRRRDAAAARSARSGGPSGPGPGTGESGASGPDGTHPDGLRTDGTHSGSPRADQKGPSDVVSSAVSEHVSAELAAALTLTGRAADSLLGLARDLSRLPSVLAALRSGAIDLPKARIFAAELGTVGDMAANQIAARYLGRATGWTTSALRRALRAAVLSHDPDAARTRSQKARADTRVETWQEDSGNASISGRELPAAQAFAADRRISQIARALKASGAPGTMDELRAGVYLALLLGTDPAVILGPDVIPAGQPARTSGGTPAGFGGGRSSNGSGRNDSGRNGSRSSDSGSNDSGSNDSNKDSAVGIAGLVGSIHLTLPAATWLGLAARPGDLTGLGPIDPYTSRDLADLLATQCDTEWHVTLTDSAGQAVAHACPRTPPPRAAHQGTGPPATGPPATGPPGTGPSGTHPGTGPPGTGPPEAAASNTTASNTAPANDPRFAWLAGLTFHWLEQDPCRHTRQTAAYRPGKLLRHLIEVRNATCTAPGCRRPAAQCDNDHTVPHDQGGRTCECNCGPLCRMHHRVKQSLGWHLDQPRPGHLIWTTSAGRTYRTEPGHLSHLIANVR